MSKVGITTLEMRKANALVISDPADVEFLDAALPFEGMEPRFEDSWLSETL